MKVSSTEGRGSPFIFWAVFMKSSPVCSCTLATPFCNTACSYTLYRSMGEGHNQLHKQIGYPKRS